MSEVSQHIRQLREDFMKGTLSEQDVLLSPDQQFNAWMKEVLASQVLEPQACVLATVTADMKPSSRVIYLREYQEHHYFFYTNYNSRKAREMKENPNVSLTFFWPELERQVRIEGTVEMASREKSDMYFKDRPKESKIGSWSSQQSSVLKDREQLENQVKAFSEKFAEADDVPRPEFWGGYVLNANYYEFWQGRKSRLHDRLSFSLVDGVWKLERLSP